MPALSESAEQLKQLTRMPTCLFLESSFTAPATNLVSFQDASVNVSPCQLACIRLILRLRVVLTEMAKHAIYWRAICQHFFFKANIKATAVSTPVIDMMMPIFSIGVKIGNNVLHTMSENASRIDSE